MLKTIKLIFNDIFQLYRNFFHFNISKIIILLVGLLYSLVVAIPFLVIGGLFYYYFNFIGGTVDVFGNNFISSILFAIFFVIAFIIIFAAFSYSYILFIRLDLKYIKGKKLSFKKNYYFNFKLFFNHIKLFLLNLLIVVSPFFVFLLLIFLLVSILGGVGKVNEMVILSAVNTFSVISFILFILTLITFIYLAYRTLFSLIILVDESKGEKFKKTSYYIKKSFKLTKGFKTFLNFVVVFILVFLLGSIIVVPNNYFSQKFSQISSYFYILQNPQTYLEKVDYDYGEYLKEYYSSYGKTDLKNEYLKYFKLKILFEILNFLFIIGLYEMALVSFYKRKLIK